VVVVIGVVKEENKRFGISQCYEVRLTPHVVEFISRSQLKSRLPLAIYMAITGKYASSAKENSDEHSTINTVFIRLLAIARTCVCV
jgi:hypothetical protein